MGISKGKSVDVQNIDFQCPDGKNTIELLLTPSVPGNKPTETTESYPYRKCVSLPHSWDQDFPKWNGQAQYRVRLEGADPQQPMALLFSRIGNQAVVKLNGHALPPFDHFENEFFDSAKEPQILVVPPEFLSRERNLLEVTIHAQSLRWGGMAGLRFGPAQEIRKAYAIEHFLRYTCSFTFAISLAFMGAIALALWFRMRDRLFACFSVGAFLGIFKNLDRIWTDVPIPWPAWGAIVSTAYAWHLAIMCLFVLISLELHHKFLRQLISAYLPVSMVLACTSFIMGKPLLWTIALALLIPIAICTWTLVVYSVRGSRTHKGTAKVLLTVGILAILAGVHDLILVRIHYGFYGQHSIMPYGIFLFVVTMGGIIVDRYARNAVGLVALNQTLESKITSKEMEIRRTYDQLQKERDGKEKAMERQRIMRDLHDGVGAQLVGLLSLVRQPIYQPDVLEEHVKAALDEMRLAIDSMQLSDGDLNTALATLRYRVLPRLQAAGLTVNWSVDESTQIHFLTPHAVLQVQRIVLEALTNVLKHANANIVWVLCNIKQTEKLFTLEVADNGKSFGAATSHGIGQGLQNMRLRAESIGAAISIGDRKGGGTSILLECPLRNSESSSSTSM